MRWFFFGVLVSTFAGCAPAAQQPSASPNASELATPPAVLSGNATLDCTISSRENGRQRLVLSAGQGLEFDAVVSPIVDGVVDTRDASRSGSYHFTSHLAGPASGTLSGIGPVTFEELETKVNVEMQHYEQPGGPGTELSFRATDLSARGNYVEFSGRALAANGDRFAFRVTLGTPGPNSGGKVTPASNASRAPIEGKMVRIEAPTIAVVSAPVRVVVQGASSESKTDVRKLP